MKTAIQRAEGRDQMSDDQMPKQANAFIYFILPSDF